jgi:RNA polymerase sigma-70 factor (ECF subfamily)
MNVQEAKPLTERRGGAHRSAVKTASSEERLLITQAKSGHSSAFGELYQRHRPRIYLTAFRILRNRQDAEDVAQRSFQRALTNLARFREDSTFSTWLTRIAISEALLLLRKVRGLRELPIDDLTRNQESRVSVEIWASNADPESSYSQREREQLLSTAMGKLTPKQRTAVELRELGDLSVREAAQLMGLSVSAVKGCLFHSTHGRNCVAALYCCAETSC